MAMMVYLGPYSDDGVEREEKITIHNYDTWSMDSTLSLIIEPMLKQLKAGKSGAPFVDDEDVPEKLRSTNAPAKENEWDTDANHFKRWDWVLDEMIFTFTALNSDYESNFYSDDDVEYEPIESVGIGPAQLRLFPDEYGNTEDYESYQMKPNPNRKSVFDNESYREYEKRIANGLMLFGKYYRGLWQ